MRRLDAVYGNTRGWAFLDGDPRNAAAFSRPPEDRTRHAGVLPDSRSMTGVEAERASPFLWLGMRLHLLLQRAGNTRACSTAPWRAGAQKRRDKCSRCATETATALKGHRSTNRGVSASSRSSRAARSARHPAAVTCDVLDMWIFFFLNRRDDLSA